MKYLAFVLTMPSVGSWNNNWSGKDKFYAVTRKFYKKDDEITDRLLKNRFYDYDFGDGWTARITIVEINAPEAKKIKRNSTGFFGYEWMVKSIIENDEIKVEKKA